MSDELEKWIPKKITFEGQELELERVEYIKDGNVQTFFTIDLNKPHKFNGEVYVMFEEEK
jgi:hypothetical protein